MRRGLSSSALPPSSAPTGRRLLPVPGESGAVVQGAGLTRRRGPHARLQGSAGGPARPSPSTPAPHRRRSIGCRQGHTPDRNRRSGPPSQVLPRGRQRRYLHPSDAIRSPSPYLSTQSGQLHRSWPPACIAMRANSSSSCARPASAPPIIWPSVPSVPRSSPARSAVAPAVTPGPLSAVTWPVSSTPGLPAASTRSRPASTRCRFLYLNSELLRRHRFGTVWPSIRCDRSAGRRPCVD